MPNSKGLKDHEPDCFEEKKSEEGEDNQSRTGSDPQAMLQQMVNETLEEVSPCSVSKTHGDTELITQEIEKWQDSMGAKIATLIELRHGRWYHVQIV